MKVKTRDLKTKDEAYRSDFNWELNKIFGFTINAKAVVGHYLSKKIKMVDARYMPYIHAYTPKCIILT